MLKSLLSSLSIYYMFLLRYLNAFSYKLINLGELFYGQGWILVGSINII
jgi:hypothetical protein